MDSSKFDLIARAAHTSPGAERHATKVRDAPIAATRLERSAAVSVVATTTNRRRP